MSVDAFLMFMATASGLCILPQLWLMVIGSEASEREEVLSIAIFLSKLVRFSVY